MSKKMFFVLLGFFCIILVLLIGTCWLGMHWYSQSTIATKEQTEFVIESGESFSQIVTRLASQSIIKHPQLFALLARIAKADTEIHVGDYLIPKGISHQALLNFFVNGQVRYYSVTLIEGKTVQEILDVFNSHPKLVEPLNIEGLSTQTKLIESLKTIYGIKNLKNLEGLFFADTYMFVARSSVASILQMASQRLVSVLTEEWDNRMEGLPYKTPYEVLIMASIIEKETGVSYERPDISGVFFRRLKKKMRLQTDPTVIYGMGDRFNGDLTSSMLRKYTPYNTYVIRGLPPTPIASVGREAIRAALHPAPGKTLFFVAKGDGTHHFSATLAEHNRAVRKYQINLRRKDYRSWVE